MSAASHGCETSAARRRMISKNGAATRRASHSRPDFLVTFVSFDKSDSHRQGLASKKGMDAKHKQLSAANQTTSRAQHTKKKAA